MIVSVYIRKLIREYKLELGVQGSVKIGENHFIRQVVNTRIYRPAGRPGTVVIDNVNL